MPAKKNFIKKDRFSSLENSAKEMRGQEEKTATSEETMTVSRFSSAQLEQALTEGKNLHLLALDSLASAPEEWNFYDALPEDKMEELVESIGERGLMHPIVVWQQEQGYMILSGHNRKAAYEILLTKTGEDRYSHIPALVIGMQEIDQETAREIIIDTNWIQRQLSPVEKAKSISEKYIRLGRKKHTGDGAKTRDLVASQYGISGRMVQSYLGLTTLIPAMEMMLRENKLTIRNAVVIARLEPETQQWLYENFRKEELSRAASVGLHQDMSKKQIQNLLQPEEEYERISLSVPKQLKSELMDLIREFLDQRQKG